MNVKDYFRRLRVLELEVERKRDRLEELRAKGVSTSNLDRERVQGGPAAGDAVQVGLLAKVEEAQGEYCAAVEAYVTLKHEIINQIQALEDWRHVEILFEKWVRRKSLQDVSRLMGYEYRHASRLHGEALKAFAAKYSAALEGDENGARP